MTAYAYRSTHRMRASTFPTVGAAYRRLRAKGRWYRERRRQGNISHEYEACPQMPWHASPVGRLISKQVSSGSSVDFPQVPTIDNTTAPKKKYGYTVCRVSTASKPHDSYASAPWMPHHMYAPKSKYRALHMTGGFICFVIRDAKECIEGGRVL